MRIIRITLAVSIVLAGLALVAMYATPAVLMWYAQRSFTAKNFARTEKALRWVLAMEPKHARAHFLYAKDVRHMSRYREADTHLGLAGELGLPKEEGIREFGLLYAGRQFSVAKGALERTLEQHADDVEVLQALAQGHIQEGRPNRAEIYL